MVVVVENAGRTDRWDDDVPNDDADVFNMSQKMAENSNLMISTSFNSPHKVLTLNFYDGDSIA